MTVQHLVIVGASWGGLAALSQLVAAIPQGFPAPIILVQHRSRHGDNLLASLLQDETALRVVDVEDKDVLEAGTVYIAPANYHLLVDDDHLSLTTDPMVKFSRPSIDVAFISAADAYRSRAIGVILTGANDDGAKGLRRIVNFGGRAIVQDPETAEGKAMPAAALRMVPEAEVLALEKIPPKLIELTLPAERRKSGLSA